MKQLRADGSVKWERDPFFNKKKMIVFAMIGLFILVTQLTNWFTAFLLTMAFLLFWKAYQSGRSKEIGTETGLVREMEQPIVFQCVRGIYVTLGIMFLYFAVMEALKDANIAMNDPQIRSRIEAAIKVRKLEARGDKGHQLLYAYNEQTPYTGWVKQRWSNGQMRLLARYENGKILTALAWRINGQKCPVTNLKDGDGTMVLFQADGTELSRSTYKDGERIYDTPLKTPNP